LERLHSVLHFFELLREIFRASLEVIPKLLKSIGKLAPFACLAALSARVKIINPRSMAAVEVDLPDHATRLSAIDKIVALYGYVPKRVEMPDPPGERQTVNIHQQAEPKPIIEGAFEPTGQDEKLTVRMSLRKD
jgi:hypothetical protein